MSAILKTIEKKVIVRKSQPPEPVLEAIEERIGMKGLLKTRKLGSGHFADVYWLPDHKKVLKLTKDVDDANACFILQHKPSPWLLKVYDVFKIMNQGRWTMYCIVSEKLTPLSSSQEKDFSLFTAFLDYWFGNHFPTLKMIENAEEHKTDSWNRWRKTYTVSDYYVDLFKNWAKALDERNIRWGDYKVDNIMARRHLPVISDLGYSSVPFENIPQLQVEGM